MPRKEHPHSSVASGAQHFENLLRDLLRVFDLTQNSDLHIVNEQRDPIAVANLFERLRDPNIVGTSHIREMSQSGFGKAKGSSGYFENFDLFGNAAE
jgi:hypothetical protein